MTRLRLFSNSPSKNAEGPWLWARRRAGAADRLPPLPDGRRDPLYPPTDAPTTTSPKEGYR